MLLPASYKLHLEGYEILADIGFHAFETGVPQRLRIDIEIWLDPAALPAGDSRAQAWDYDFLRHEIAALAAARRHDLQESLAGAIYAMIAARPGVTALRVRTAKPDVYPDCAGVAVELASFGSVRPHGPSCSSTKP